MDKYRPLEGDSGRRTMSLFLSLYLIVLVFLIALLSLSSFDGLRFEVGSKSVRDSFKNHFKAKAKEIRFTEGNDEGFLLHTDDASSDLPKDGNVFLRELPLVKVVEAESGKIMYADIDKDDYFTGSEINPEKRAFFENMCGFLKRHDGNGRHYNLKFIFGESSGNNVYPIAADDNYRRAETLAGFISECGAGAENISIGVDAVDYAKIRIIFSVEDDEQ